MATTTNPFEPPRTTDLDSAASPGPLVLSDEALRELVAAAPWTRWLARLTSLSIAIGLVKWAMDVLRVSTSGKFAPFLSVAVSTATSTTILVVLRRYAAASHRLPADPHGGVPQVIAAQLAYLKRVGKIAALAVGFLAIIALIMLIGVVAKALR